MDNQEHRPNWRNQIDYIMLHLEYIVYGELLLLDCLLPWLSFLLRKLIYILTSSSVKLHMLVTGETFQTHETFMQKLKLQIELCSAERSNVILLFCPVVSRIGTDMEAAMARVTEDKPVILVFMHHCHDPSHMSNSTVHSSSKIVKSVDCAFHESYGLLQCIQNEEAVAEVRSTLQTYKQTNRRCPGGERIKINSVRPSYTRF
ncbi:uncharacterized protein [Paramormyrops kingsleyae]|uniref:uncharacterized protein isoform X1 n=1 Tax=Paramormyrops kingsleyae TaxID=1676925 RepID=UPI003B977F4B